MSIELKVTADSVQDLFTHIQSLNDLRLLSDLVTDDVQVEDEPEVVEGPVQKPKTKTIELSDVPGEVEIPIEEDTLQVDADGLPWNEDIHASSKAKNKDGTWRRKRGVTDEQVAEYAARFDSSVPPEQFGDDDTPAPGETEPSKPINDTPIASNAEKVFKVATSLISSQEKTAVYMIELAQYAGVSSLSDILKNEEAANKVAEKLKADGFEV